MLRFKGFAGEGGRARTRANVETVEEPKGNEAGRGSRFQLMEEGHAEVTRRSSGRLLTERKSPFLPCSI